MKNTELLIRLRELHEELLQINESGDRLHHQAIEELGEVLSRISDLIDRSNTSTPQELQRSVQPLFRLIDPMKGSSPVVNQFLTRVESLLDHLCS